MIVDLPATSTTEINKKLDELREKAGAVTLGPGVDVGDRARTATPCSRSRSTPPTRPVTSTPAG